MDIFDVLNLIGGLALFLFGMNVMGAALEKRAGNSLKNILGTMTSSTMKGFLLGLGVTAVIQSSSATTVMAVGFVNSGIMTLHQATGVIMGANIGTSVTSWLLSLSDIDGESLFIQLLKPTSFVPVLALIGVILYVFKKQAKSKDTGLILLGFAVLMFGMETMSDAVSGLKDVPQFTQILTIFSNPILGVIMGAAITAIIQSSSASVGILQALAATGSIPFSTAIPIIMGQNIGTCVSAIISCVGASKNAKRTAMLHLLFNVMTTVILLPVYCIVNAIFDIPLFDSPTSAFGIAVCHTVFNVLAVVILMPCSRLLEKLATVLVKESKSDGPTQLLDERLIVTPAIALSRSRQVTVSMAELAIGSVNRSFGLISDFDAKKAENINAEEDEVDLYEDKLGSYLVKVSQQNLTATDTTEVDMLLHLIGDFERISDHAVNIAESAEELHDKKLSFSEDAARELSVLSSAVTEITNLALTAFKTGDAACAYRVEPLEQVVDRLKEHIRRQHIIRLQKQQCNIELGFILSDLLTDFERISDHCSNIAGCLIEMSHDGLGIHEYLRGVKGGKEEAFNVIFEEYKTKYAL